MQGRLMHRARSSPSIFWTVFSSKNRAPVKYPATMFSESWVLGPAAGPKGVSIRPPNRGSPGRSASYLAWTPKTVPSWAYSVSTRSRSLSKGMGFIRSLIGHILLKLYPL